MSVCRVFGAATGVMVVGATNVVIHSYVNPTALARLAKMLSRSVLCADRSVIIS